MKGVATVLSMNKGSDTINTERKKKKASVPSDPSNAIPLTSTLKGKIKAEIKRTGITARMLLANDIEKPEGLTSSMINRWIGGVIKTASQAHLDYVLQKWSGLADNAGRVLSEGILLPTSRSKFASASSKPIAITKKMSLFLRAEFERTGMSPHNFMDNIENVPDGLTSRIIQGWLYQHAKTGNAAFWNFVQTHLKSRPDKKGNSLPSRKPYRIPENKPEHREITAEERNTLINHRERTRIGGSVLLRGAVDKPQGLSASMISGWLTGVTKTALPIHINYVICRQYY